MATTTGSLLNAEGSPLLLDEAQRRPRWDGTSLRPYERAFFHRMNTIKPPVNGNDLSYLGLYLTTLQVETNPVILELAAEGLPALSGEAAFSKWVSDGVGPLAGKLDLHPALRKAKPCATNDQELASQAGLVAAHPELSAAAVALAAPIKCNR